VDVHLRKAGGNRPAGGGHQVKHTEREVGGGVNQRHLGSGGGGASFRACQSQQQAQKQHWQGCAGVALWTVTYSCNLTGTRQGSPPVSIGFLVYHRSQLNPTPSPHPPGHPPHAPLDAQHLPECVHRP
jgi:hypothetical protein